MLRDYVAATVNEIVDYSICFYYKDDPGCGFSFACDKDGKPAPFANKAASDNYEWCLANPELFGTFNEVQKNRRRVKEPAHGRCTCGREVYLYDQYYGSCECECGRWYNLFGQELYPPRMWNDEVLEYD